MSAEVHFFVNGQQVDSIELEDNIYDPDKCRDTFMIEYGWEKKLKPDDTIRVALVLEDEDKRLTEQKRFYCTGGNFS